MRYRHKKNSSFAAQRTNNTRCRSVLEMPHTEKGEEVRGVGERGLRGGREERRIK